MLLPRRAAAAVGASSQQPSSRGGTRQLTVSHVFRLTAAVDGLMRPRSSNQQNSKRRMTESAASVAVDAPPAAATPTATTQTRRSNSSSSGRDSSSSSSSSSNAAAHNLSPRKAVQAVPAKDRETVELVMALNSLAPEPADTLAMQLAEHELTLVTTSATCDAMFASMLDSMSDDYGSAGDGMATPLADIRAAAEAAAAQVSGSSMSAAWVPPARASAGSARSFGSKSAGGGPAAGGSRHALEQLMAAADHTSLSGTYSRSRDATSVMGRVQALQAQIKVAAGHASKAAASRASGNSSSAASSTASAGSSPSRRAAPAAAAAAGAAAGTAAAAAAAAAMDALPRLDRGQLPLTESFDEDSCGDACAMPVIPGTGGLFAGASAAAAASANSLPPFARAAAVAAARAAASAAVSSHQQHQHQQQQRYPVYGDPCSSWMVADSADGRTRIISIQAPAALAAAVAGGRASSDLTTFESYSLGAKINKALYAEANALYNRFMPLLLDHMEEAGPAGRVMLTGQGLGGALAALLLLMCAARGVRTSAFAPVYTLNAPAVLCEVPDFKQWCSKDGCSLQDMDGMMEDLLHRGILSQLGLPQDAVRNVYHNQGAAEGAVRAVQARLGPLAAVAASGSRQLSSAIAHLDVGALVSSPFVPEVLKAWLHSEGSGQAAGAQQRLHILNPVGKMLLYVATAAAPPAGGGSAASASRPPSASAAF